MKINKKRIYLICSLVLLVVIYCICLLCFGNHDNQDGIEAVQRIIEEYLKHEFFVFEKQVLLHFIDSF